MGKLCTGLLCLLVLRCMVSSVEGFNITEILEPYSSFSLFNQWLTLTGVATEVNNHTAITVLATPNSALQPYLSIAQASNNLTVLADTLRYQVLLEYFGWTELQRIPRGQNSSATTLLQTTGRYNTTQGLAEIYNNGSQYILGHSVPDSYGNITIQGNITQQPYNYSILQVTGVLLPLPVSGLVPSPAPSKAPLIAPAKAPVGVLAPPTGPLAAPAGRGEGSYANAHSASSPLVLGALFLVAAIFRLS